MPRDDESTWHFQWFFDTTREIDVAHRIEEGGIWLDENFRKKLNIDNWYGQDRNWMKSGLMSGIKGVVTQDHSVCETQGRILDRSKEHLGTSDAAVVAWRRLMIRSARALAETGKAPPGTEQPIDWAKISAETVKLSGRRVLEGRNQRRACRLIRFASRSRRESNALRSASSRGRRSVRPRHIEG